MEEYEKSDVTSHKDIKRFALDLDPSTVTVIEGENISGGAETGSTGERDMHSDATSKKHLAPPARSSDVPKEEDSSLSSGSGRESALMNRPNDGDDGEGRLQETESSTPSSQLESRGGHASDFQSAEGLASDMPDRKGIHKPASSGDRATDITGIPYIQ